MKNSLRWLMAAALLMAALALLALMTALQGEPAVAERPPVDHQDVARALSLLRTHDPRQARPGTVSTALLGERDLEVLLSHGAQRWLHAASRVSLQRGHATLQLSSELPPNPFGRWLNLKVEVMQTSGLPVIDRLQVGRLPLPAMLAEPVAWALAERAGLRRELTLAGDIVRRVRFEPRQLLVTYAWQGDSARRLFDGLLAPAELERLQVYSDRLTVLTSAQQPYSTLPMVALLAPLFELAQQRSAAGGDAALENRAALVVLTLYANGRAVGAVAATARSWAPARPLRLLLANRADFPLHFLVSATLASEGTTPLSRAIGVYKEVADSRKGSGFSFNDMAANRAGTRFGELAVGSPQALQQRIAHGLAEDQLLPRVDDLPEFLSEPEFLRRFGGVGAPPYNALLAEIDRRIAALALLH